MSLVPSTYLPESINEQLRAHVGMVEEWPKSERLEKLYEWSELMALEFKLQIPTPALQIGHPGRQNVLGFFRGCRNGFGLSDEILIADAQAASDNMAEVLTTLLHELLHQWQLHHGIAGRRNYHNKQYRTKAGSLGLRVDSRGITAVERGFFTQLLEHHGVEIGELTTETLAVPTPIPGNSKMRKYACECTTVRCAVELVAVCSRCRKAFAPAVARWHRVIRAR